jgi:hypothetical protein
MDNFKAKSIVNMVKNSAFCWLLIGIVFQIHAQDMLQVRSDLNTLASKAMFGRGYVFNGQAKAAQYLQKRFKAIGLEPLGNNYLQTFTMPIHTFPGKVDVKVNNAIWQTGVDYILAADCPAAKGTFTIEQIDTIIFSNHQTALQWLSRRLDDKCVVVPAKFRPQVQQLINNGWRPGMLAFEEPKKLTASLSQEKGLIPAIIFTGKTLNTGDKIRLNIQAKTYAAYPVSNVVGYVKGSEQPDSFYVFTAHYDHLGGMGKNVFFPGANDNASGTALLLALAEYYARNKPKYSVAFIAFAAEEAGLVGSFHFTANPLIPLENILFVLNTDLAGTGDDGITVVNATAFEPLYQRMDSINRARNLLPQVVRRAQTANSDHYPFSLKSVPAFFIYTRGGIAAYHDVFDKPETLPLTKFKELFTLLCLFLESEPKAPKR